MSMDYIRTTYGLACKRGQRVRYSPPGEPAREGTIIGAEGQYLRIRLDPLPGMACKTGNFHPTWCLSYYI